MFTESSRIFGEDGDLAPEGREILFYDGTCGICHSSVQFALRRDRGPIPLLYAPLEGETCRRLISDEQRAALPDSIILRMPDGELVTASTAILRVMGRFSAPWRALAATLTVVPRVIRDLAYDAVARVRMRLLGRKPEACPLVPQELRARFLE